MTNLRRFLALISLAVVASAAATGPAPLSPAQKAQQDGDLHPLSLEGTTTDSDTIAATIGQVDQKAGATDSAPPSSEVPETVVTAADGSITDAGSGSDALLNILHSDATDPAITTGSVLQKRLLPGYEQVFAGTGTGPTDRDGSIQGTAYLTYTVVSNATYNVDACLQFCSNVNGCVFANLYYEFNNELLDFVFSEHSNLKCAVYGDVHTAAEKTNMGGQQSIPPPADLTYIQHSSGYAATSLSNPDTPEGYEYVFGPTNGANNSPGYMGFAFLDKYDVQACANLCNTRGPDGSGGACQYFNIWRAVVNGNPTTYTCSMYYIPSDASTATNTGQGDLRVTFSRGYRRKSYLLDGGFEGYNACGDFCYTTSYSNWIGTSPAGGFQDATIFHYGPYAHSGHGVGLLGSATGADNLAGTLSPAQPLTTVAGKHYTITFFHSSQFSGPSLEANAFVEVVWNGNVIGSIHPGYSGWTFYHFEVTAVGGDILGFHGGAAPAWSFIDDIYVFLV